MWEAVVALPAHELVPFPEFDALWKQAHLDVDVAIEASPERLWVPRIW